MTRNVVIHGDSLVELKKLDTNSIDALICDPPAGISFMNKEFDHDKGGRRQWIAWLCSIMEEVYRVLKPGAYGLVWSLPRTSHWTATALEDAGFEIRDSIYHIFGSGFPKSHDVSKAIDRMAGVEREVVGTRPAYYPDTDRPGVNEKQRLTLDNPTSWSLPGIRVNGERPITAPATDLAKKYSGYGTSLKPAVEVWWLIRKPLASGSIAKNVVEYGTGAINIDACRIPTNETLGRASSGWQKGSYIGGEPAHFNSLGITKEGGRWPSHLLLSHLHSCTQEQCDPGCPIAMMDEQSGTSKGQAGCRRLVGGIWKSEGDGGIAQSYGDSGGASRYFQTFHPDPFVYAPKASRRERNAGCEALPVVPAGGLAGRHDGSQGTVTMSQNNHPTVKSQTLMRYLVRLITPPEGVVLDCFGGSGSTALACIAEGKDYILIEQEAEYVAIAQARIAHAQKERPKKVAS